MRPEPFQARLGVWPARSGLAPLHLGSFQSLNRRFVVLLVRRLRLRLDFRLRFRLGGSRLVIHVVRPKGRPALREISSSLHSSRRACCLHRLHPNRRV